MKYYRLHRSLFRFFDIDVSVFADIARLTLQKVK